MESTLFRLLEVNRERTLELIDSTDPALLQVIPDGFNNNLHWHIGHILTTQERLAFRFIGEKLELEESLMNCFVNGTKPADWTEGVPEVSQLIPLLREQPGRIRSRLAGKLNQSITIPFKDFTTLSEVLLFSLSHEGLHQGYMMALRRAVSVTVRE